VFITMKVATAHVDALGLFMLAHTPIRTTEEKQYTTCSAALCLPYTNHAAAKGGAAKAGGNLILRHVFLLFYLPL
jgi:hypothetical protein